MSDIPRLQPNFRQRLLNYVGADESTEFPNTLDSIANEQRAQRRILEFIVNHLDDEERAFQIEQALKYPRLSFEAAVWRWLKAFLLVVAGGAVQWFLGKPHK